MKHIVTYSLSHIAHISVAALFRFAIVCCCSWFCRTLSGHTLRRSSEVRHQSIWPTIYLERCMVGLVVSALDCQTRGPGFKSRPGQKFGSRFLLHLSP